MKGFLGNFVVGNKKGMDDSNMFHNEMANELKERVQGRDDVQNFGEEAMYVDHYSGTYYSLITKYKKKYHLLSEDQA